ncbi:MAG TPA: Fur family transcriptional regulator [Chloroflexota bacterium]|jgi:Fur family ferric uptake transcriptional regulator
MATAEDFRKALKAHGLRMTPQRQLILDVLATMRGHIAVDQVYRQVAARYPDVNITTVYRTLEVLEERGIVRHTHFHDGRSQFERTDEPAHQHLVCKLCGRDQETDLSVLEPLTESLREKFGFEADFSHTAIVGYCAACKSRSPARASD